MMERMPQDLQRHIEVQAQKRGGQPFELHVAIDIMLQVAKAMHYLHKNKIVHRDLKTSNILVDDSTEGYVLVKLADFGLAKTYANTQTVGTQTTGGTTRYAAPEVNLDDDEMIDGKKTRFLTKADVWSFAMVCSEILTGNIPFKGMDVKQSEIHAKIAEPNFRPLLPNDSCFDYLRFCITSCWSHNQEKRPNFSTICQMLKLAKMLSLGVTSFDTCKSLFSRNPPIWMDPKNDNLESRCISASMIGRDYIEYRSPLKYCSPLLREPWLDVVTTRPLSQGGVRDVGQAYWIDDPTGGVSYSVAARRLNVSWNTEEYWKWILPCSGARSSEVAHLQKVCWFEMGGLIDWPLLPGAYTLSWRLQLTPEAYRVEDHGWLKHPVVFELGLNKSTPFKQIMRYLANEDVEKQELLGTNLTPVRLVGDNWFEYDAGEINIMDSGENANFSFSMKEINPDKGLWKRELLVDGVVLRPTSLIKTIGQSLFIGELAERHNNFVNQGFRYL
ncbi:hypothetical protein CY35_10G018300 [Sphagnum magellanicum]|nr:hypothetical protein CY35_10G018300 [Sphagnum magellanicum]